jgi:hypothetical protein
MLGSSPSSFVSFFACRAVTFAEENSRLLQILLEGVRMTDTEFSEALGEFSS